MTFSSVIKTLKTFFIGPDLSLQKPTVIQFPIIDICNSKCQMCRIWENKKSNDITVEQLKTGLKSGLFSEVSSIGFNGGEPTLREDLSELVTVVVNTLPKLNSVSLITNAFKYKQVNEQIDEMAKIVKAKGLHFDVMVSLDGFEDIHDKVRGRTGNFANAQKVINHIKTSGNIDNIRIGCTVIKENVLHLADLLEFCIKNELYIKYRLGVPHQRLYTENLLDPYALSFNEKYEFVEFLEGLITNYETSYHQIGFYRSLIGQIINDKPRSSGCDWKHRGATITAKGELAYCAVQSKTLMENISVGDPSKAYFENKAHLNEIINNKCDQCNHDYVGLPTKSEYRKLLINKVLDKYNLKPTIKALPIYNWLKKSKLKKAFTNSVSHYRNVNNSVENIVNNTLNKKVLICGWYGTETLGDKAIIAGVMEGYRLKFGNDTEFYVVALFNYITQMTKSQMVEFRNCRIITPEVGVQIVKNMDFVTFGGGPLMALNELAPMQVIFEKAKKYNVSTITAGCGVGPFGEDYHNRSIARILNLSDVRIYRDERSKNYAADLGVNVDNDKVAEDPAFTWLSKIGSQLQNSPPAIYTSPSKKIILLGLRDFPYQDYARHLSEEDSIQIKNNYELSVIKALSKLVLNDPNIIIRPLPMCTNHFGSDDRWFYRRLFRNELQLSNNLDYSLLGAEMPPLSYCEAFKSADVLLAMRFHSLVFGIGLGVNSIALDYTLGKGKVKSLAERFDVELMSMLDLDADNLADVLLEQLSKNAPAPILASDLNYLSDFNTAIGKL